MDELDRFCDLVKMSGGSSDVMFTPVDEDGLRGSPTRYGRRMDPQTNAVVVEVLVDGITIRAMFSLVQLGGMETLYNKLNAADCWMNDY